MITVKQAQRLIIQNIPARRKERVSLAKSLGCILAEEIRAPFPLPLFDNSAMDGYALDSAKTRFTSPDTPLRLEIKGVIKAGDNPRRFLRGNETYKIMTGGLIPPGADTVLAQEEAIVQSGSLKIHCPVPKGRHVRYRGEEVRKGSRLLRKQTILQPGTIGILASLGRKKVTVYEKPRVSLIATGSELVRVGGPLPRGKIYNSNSAMIKSALKKMGISPLSNRTVTDKPAVLKKVIASALKQSDVLVLMGGVSAGDYDYVKEVLEQLKVRRIFWKVSQKPGKPIYFGRKANKLIWGLPGNPASVFTCFYEYVFPALRAMMGFMDPHLEMEETSLSGEIMPDRKRTLFLKGKRIKGKVKLLSHQGSHMLSSLCQADCLLVVAPGGTVVRKGKKIKIHLLP